MSTSTLIMDKAGRIVIPKAVRKELHLQPGDSLEMEKSGEQITLRPVRETARLIKKHGFWVVAGTGETLTVEDTNALIEQMRLERDLANLGIQE